jgi:multidrug efflux pump subunit AcrB
VDNAIVIVENIYRFMEQGVSRVEAAIRATSEVAWPVIGSTLTTLAAFFPLVFWPGLMGEFMSYLPITLIITLSSSLFVAMVINPALCAFLMKLKGDAANVKEVSAEEVEQSGEQPIKIEGWILTNYAKLLRGALNRKFIVLGISFAVLVVLIEVWVLTVGMEKPVELFPSIDPKSVYINVEPPEGADLDYVDNILKQTEIALLGGPTDGSDTGSEIYNSIYTPREHVKADGQTFMGPGDINNIEHVYTKAVLGATSSVFDENLPNHVAVQFLDFQDRKTATIDDLAKIRDRMQNIAGAGITVDMQKEGPPTGAPINIEISGDNYIRLGQIAAKVREEAAKVPHVYDVRDNYVAGLPSVLVHIDRQRAALFGLSTSSLGFALKTAYNGLDITTYYEGDDEYDVYPS